MPSIKVLPDEIVNKIAAGEVIERPASVVRELIDNAIDAGASRIEVEMMRGGSGLIRVSDNGDGMDREDAVLCIEPHATSKINDIDDLMNISTLGFRGEALAAIASVSRIRIMTSTGGASTGTLLEASGGAQKKVQEIAPVRGTVVEVRDLFFNTPARRKFLKSITTETSHIIETITQKALAYPEIAFTLRNNRAEIFHTDPAGNVMERFIQVFGRDLLERFVSLEQRSDAITIHGFVSKSGYQRSSRGQQYLFINRRPVKNPTVTHAIYSVYRELLSEDQHPSYLLFIHIDPALVDFNVHPAKREIRFREPERIHAMLRNTIKDAIAPPSSPSLRLASSHYTVQSQTSAVSPSVHEPLFDKGAYTAGRELPARAVSHNRECFHIGGVFYGVLMDDGLMIIDHHAAHERVMYERLLRGELIKSEQLLIPLRVELPPAAYTLILDNQDILRDFSIEVDDFGNNNVIVRAAPYELHGADMKSLLMDIAEALREAATEGINRGSNADRLRRGIAARLACYRAVRGSDRLTEEEISALVQDLEKTDVPDRCPHGRPTRILLSMEQLRKMFKRQ